MATARVEFDIQTAHKRTAEGCLQSWQVWRLPSVGNIVFDNKVLQQINSLY